jgi:LacI family transcriptional regulator
MILKDIASKANVSEAAVSIALNNKKGVSDETRKRIISSAEQEGYKTKKNKTGEKPGTQRIVRLLACIGEGAVAQGFDYAPFFGALIQKLTMQCNALGYNLLISSVNLNNITDELAEVENTLASDGIILLATNLDVRHIKKVAAIQKKIVVIDNSYDNISINCVTMNNRMGGFQAADHLYKSGHRRIGYAQSKNSANNLFLRKKAFYDYLSENGIQVDCEFYVTGNIEQATFDFIREFKSCEKLPTAFACENDYIGIALIKALQDSGYSVPGDVSVVGFDDIANAAIVSPELTTIRVYTDEISEIAVKRLASLLENRSKHTCKFFVDTDLIKRKSVRNILEG